MNTKKWIVIATCFAGSNLLVFLLYLISYKVNHAPNGFIRLYRPHTIQSVSPLDIQFSSYYIAGAGKTFVYLNSNTAPFFMLGVNIASKDTQHLFIRLADNIKNEFKSVKLEVDSPYFFIKDGLSPAILKGKIPDMIAYKNMYDSNYFTASTELSTTSFVLRTSRNNIPSYILAKQQNDSPRIRFAPGLLENQVDGFFSTDGMLLYNRILKRLIYIYRYRNQFLCMDSNLHLLYKGKTIDTTSWAKVKVASLNANKTRQLSAPPLLVNNKSCTFGYLLFVNSKLMANNEDKKEFAFRSVIDVYDLRSGVYRFSFYLSDFRNEKINDMAVINETLVAIHDHYLVAYRLDPKIFI